MGRYRSRDGDWTVEVVSLIGTPGMRDGQWIQLRRHGVHVADVRNVGEVAQYLNLADLEAEEAETSRN